MKKLKDLKLRDFKTSAIDDVSNISNDTVLIRTHGEPPSTYKILKENNNKIIDATCPVVLKLQERIKSAFDNISIQKARYDNREKRPR
jgi:4-hydroxy-3-methylbut-2-enyl diphosphate reductase